MMLLVNGSVGDELNSKKLGDSWGNGPASGTVPVPGTEHGEALTTKFTTRLPAAGKALMTTGTRYCCCCWSCWVMSTDVGTRPTADDDDAGTTAVGRANEITRQHVVRMDDLVLSIACTGITFAVDDVS